MNRPLDPRIATLLDQQLSRRHLLLEIAAVAADELAEIGVDLRVVGGVAVATWTNDAFLSTDIDVLIPSSDAVEAAMAALGLVRMGRHWSVPGTDLGIEAPAAWPEPWERFEPVRLASGRTIALSTPEDLAVRRVDEFLSTGHRESYQQIEALCRRTRFDHARLDVIAEERGIAIGVERLREFMAIHPAGEIPPADELHELHRAIEREMRASWDLGGGTGIER